MLRFAWKPEKNEWLKKERGISFEQIENSIATNGMKATLVNRVHPDQIVMVVDLDGYVVAVPATVSSKVVLLRTAYYSRKLNALYGGKKL